MALNSGKGKSLRITADLFIRKFFFTIVNSPNNNVIISPELRDKAEKLLEESSTESENSNSSELNETQMKNYQNCESYIFILFIILSITKQIVS